MSVEEIMFCIDNYRATHGDPPTHIVAGARARRAMLEAVVVADGVSAPPNASFLFAGLPVSFKDIHGIALTRCKRAAEAVS